MQSLVGSSSPNLQRTNVLESFFILTRQNTTWTGVGYVVDTASTNYFNPLYRFSMSTNVVAAECPGAALTVNYLANTVLPISPTNTSMSHLMDGVVDLRVRAYDPGGHWMTNLYLYYGTNASLMPPTGTSGTYAAAHGAKSDFTCSATRCRRRWKLIWACSKTASSSAPNRCPAIPLAQSNYLAQQAGKVHVFRQRVWIRNVDPSAYQ